MTFPTPIDIKDVRYYYLDGTIDGGENVHTKQLHRLDGPAIEIKYDNGHFSYRYFIFDMFLGENLSPKHWEKLKNKTLKECIFK